MASWLRLLISTMEKSTPAYDSESLDHVKQAIELIRSDPVCPIPLSLSVPS